MEHQMGKERSLRLNPNRFQNKKQKRIKILKTTNMKVSPSEAALIHMRRQSSLLARSLTPFLLKESRLCLAPKCDSWSLLILLHRFTQYSRTPRFSLTKQLAN